MGTIKKVTTNAFIYVALGFLAPAVNFFLIPIYSKSLTPSDFGIITLATIVTSVLINISGMGITGAYSRFYYDVLSDDEKLRELFSSSVLAIVFFSGILGILVFLLGQPVLDIVFKNDQFTIVTYGLFMILTAFFSNVQSMVLSNYRNGEKVKLYSFWAIFFFVAVVAGIYWGVVIMNKGAVGSIGGLMWGVFVASLTFLAYYFVGKGRMYFSFSLVKRMLSYGTPLVFYLLLTLGFNSVDKIMLERYLSLEALGLYGFAYLVATVIEILINALNSAVNPQIFRLLKEGNPGSQPRIREMISGNILVMLFVMTWIMAASGPAVEWFIDKRYHETIYYMPLLVVAYIPRLLFTYYNIPFFYFHKTQPLPWISAVSLLFGIALNMLLLPLLSIYGVCLAVFLTRVIQCSLAWIISRRMNIVPKEAFYLRKELLLSLAVLLMAVISVIFQQQLSPKWQVWAYLPMAVIYTTYLLLYITRKRWWKKLFFISNG